MIGPMAPRTTCPPNAGPRISSARSSHHVPRRWCYRWEATTGCASGTTARKHSFRASGAPSSPTKIKLRCNFTPGVNHLLLKVMNADAGGAGFYFPRRRSGRAGRHRTGCRQAGGRSHRGRAHNNREISSRHRTTVEPGARTASRPGRRTQSRRRRRIANAGGDGRRTAHDARLAARQLAE